MNQTTEHIHLTEIDRNHTAFLMSYGYDLGPLKQSIDRAGLINPPVVRKKPDPGLSDYLWL